MSYSHGKGEGRGGHCTLAEYSRNLWGNRLIASQREETCLVYNKYNQFNLLKKKKHFFDEFVKKKTPY